jgi:hypothetical protein
MTVNVSDFQFVVQLDAAPGKPAQYLVLEMRPYMPSDQPWLASVWRRLSDGLSAAHKKLNVAEPEWNSWKPWDWCEKQKPGYGLRQTHLGWVGDELVGFLNVWPEYESPNSPGQKLVYIEHLAATPWNVPTQLWRRKYKAIGLALLAYTAKLSQDLGYGGLFGLHASSSDALNFYRSVGANRKPALFLSEKTGVLGPTPHGNPGDLSRTYLETTPLGAINLLEDYRYE